MPIAAFLLAGDQDKGIQLAIEVLKVEGGFEGSQRAATKRVLARFAVIQEIGGREEASDGLDAARFFVDWILRLGIALFTAHTLHERQVPAG